MKTLILITAFNVEKIIEEFDGECNILDVHLHEQQRYDDESALAGAKKSKNTSMWKAIESQKDKPFAPVRFHDGKALETRIYYYRYNPYEYNQLYPYGYFRYQPNPYSQGNNSGGYRGSTNTGGGQVRDTEAGTTHTNTIEVNDRKKN